MSEKEKEEQAVFEAAFNALDEGQIFEGKFGKPGEQFQAIDEPDEEEIECVKEVQDLRLMEDTFGFVEKRDHSKYWIPSSDTEDDAFATMLNETAELASSNQESEPKQRVNKKSKWNTLADASSEATVIDLRDLFETSAVRELSHRLQSGKFFRVVYGGEKGFTKELLTRYLNHEDFGALKAVFAFSPDSKETNGLAIIQIK